MHITSIAHAEEILQTYIPAASRTGDGQSLERMWPLLEKLGNPQDKLKVIHIAGTSGKTSTSYYIAAALQASGQSVGLTVSPHVDSIVERVQINGQSLTDEVFCRDLGEFFDLVGQPDVSYFELLIVFVLWEFVRYDVDYAVLETGLGGLLDSTNVVTRQDKVCVLTDIGYDHMQVLGHTLADIATQKAGIIHEGNVVFSQDQAPEAMQPIQKRAKEKGGEINVVSEKEVAEYTLLDSYQQRNWALAQTVAQYMASRDGFTLEVINPSQVTVPGRMEIRQLKDDSLLVMDGAHNRQKTQAFVKSFQTKFPDQQATVLLALKEGKETDEVLRALQPITAQLICTAFTTYQDLPFTAQDPQLIAKQAEDLGMEAIAIQDYAAAYKELLAANNVKIVTGSFYLLGQVRGL